MSITITDVDAFTSPVTSPATAELADQAKFLEANQILADRTRYLFNRLGEPTLLAANQIMARGSTGPTAGKASSDFTLTQLALTTAVEHADNIHTKGENIASATTTNIAAATGMFVHITGVTTIEAFGTAAAGVQRTLRFSGVLILTHNATSLILPTGANITTAANDTLTAISEGSGNWRVSDYQKANGNSLNPGGSTLQSSYNAGNAIAATTARPVAFSNAVDATDLLTLGRTFVGGGNALTVRMGEPGDEAVTGRGVDIQSGTGATGTMLHVANQGSGKLVDFLDGVATVFDIDGAGAVRMLPTSGQGVTATVLGAGSFNVTAVDGDIKLESTGLGNTDLESAVDINVSATNELFLEGSVRIIASSPIFELVSPLFRFAQSEANPVIEHETDATADATGDLFVHHAQDVSGGGTLVTGGALTLRAGDSSGAATTHTGGVLTLASGIGDENDGEVFVKRGATAVIETTPIATKLIGPFGVQLQIVGNTRFVVEATLAEFMVPDLRFDNGVINPVFRQETAAADDATGQLLSIVAQIASGAGTTTVGGSIFVSGGAATGSPSGSATGGDATFASGEGTDVDGEVAIKRGAVDVLNTSPGGTALNAPLTSLIFRVGGTNVLLINTFKFDVRVDTFEFATSRSTPMIAHQTDTADDVTGDLMTFHAQSMSGNGAVVGGALLVHGGDTTAADTTAAGGAATFRGGDTAATGESADVGGACIVRPGAGDTGGVLSIQQGDGTTLFQINDTGIGVNGVAPIARPAAYTLTATQVPSRTLNASSSADVTNNNNVLSQLISDLTDYGWLQ